MRRAGPGGPARTRGSAPPIRQHHRSWACLIKWHWAEAPAPQRRTPLRSNVGQTLSSVNPGGPSDCFGWRIFGAQARSASLRGRVPVYNAASVRTHVDPAILLGVARDLEDQAPLVP